MIEATSCGGVVIHRGKILTLYKSYRNRYEGWVLPKGTVEPGETHEQTALREVKEETGLDISIQDGFRQAVEYFPKPNVRKQVVYFLGEAQSVEFKMQEEEISRILKTECASYTRKCTICGRELSWDYPFSICERCFERGKRVHPRRR